MFGLLRVSHTVSSIISSLTEIFLKFFESFSPVRYGVFDFTIQLSVGLIKTIWLENRIPAKISLSPRSDNEPLRSPLKHNHLVVRTLTIPKYTESVGSLILPVSNKPRETVWSKVFQEPLDVWPRKASQGRETQACVFYYNWASDSPGSDKLF